MNGQLNSRTETIILDLHNVNINSLSIIIIDVDYNRWYFIERERL